jgi:radical SAM-linked protein
MNVRVKFRKYGCLKFIGHLDVMRYFQKAMRRADIDMCYSEGFSPHMIMSFASPLGLGLTSDGEYMDISIQTPLSSREAIDRLNAVMVEGIDVVSWRELPENSKNAMSIVAAADYEVRFREDMEPVPDWQERFAAFLDQKEIRVVKETKKGQQELDIRPWIYDWEIKDHTIFMQVSAGSVHNLKPELVMQAFGEFLGTKIKASSLFLHRTELYADQGTENNRKLIALEDLGSDIV